MADVMKTRKAAAKAWFEQLRDQLCATLEAIEAQAIENDPAGLYAAHTSDQNPKTFERTPWRRNPDNQPEKSADQGGGVMSMLRGAVFEKAGVHTSSVQGEFSPEFAKQIPGADKDPRFWASGVSVIIHPRNPHIPAAHMNTRMIVTTKCWFGGGGDLNPMTTPARERDHKDALDFHAAMKSTCDKYDNAFYEKFSEWCETYFYLPHRNEARGVGGIFYDRHDTGNWDTDFAFTKDVGSTFATIYPEIARRRMNTPWSQEDLDQQSLWRGRYAEFNLLYDRGTQFGLKTGGNVDAILSSLPPMARWT